jgi:hypothetical protein
VPVREMVSRPPELEELMDRIAGFGRREVAS